MIAAVIILVSFAMSTSAQPTPRGFDDCYLLVGSRNVTTLDTGVMKEHQAIREWAAERSCSPDGKRKKTTECTLGNHQSAASIHIERSIYLIDTVTEYCLFLIMPVAPTQHNWGAQNSTYVGEGIIREMPINIWVKDDHYWYETQYGPRPYGFTFPTDGANFGEEFYSHYAAQSYSQIEDRFAIPSFCPESPQGSWDDFIQTSLSRRMQGLQNDFECFVVQ